MRKFGERGAKPAFLRFLRAQSGAVTVDWVVLTAAVVGIGLASLTVVSRGAETVARAVDGELGPSSGRPSGAGGGVLDPVNTSGDRPGVHDPHRGDPAQDPVSDRATGGASDPGERGDSSAGGSGGDTHSDGGGNVGNDSAHAGSDIDTSANNSASDNDARSNDTSTAGNVRGAGGGGGSGGNDDRDTAPREVDFTFDDLDIGCWWSDRAVSNWVTFNLDANTAFTLRGEGNPTAQNAQGLHAASGEARWGTNIHVDIPPPGTSRTVYMDVGDRTGSFTITRAACP